MTKVLTNLSYSQDFWCHTYDLLPQENNQSLNIPLGLGFGLPFAGYFGRRFFEVTQKTQPILFLQVFWETMGASRPFLKKTERAISVLTKTFTSTFLRTLGTAITSYALNFVIHNGILLGYSSHHHEEYQTLCLNHSEARMVLDEKNLILQPLQDKMLRAAKKLSSSQEESLDDEFSEIETLYRNLKVEDLMGAQVPEALKEALYRISLKSFKNLKIHQLNLNQMQDFSQLVFELLHLKRISFEKAFIQPVIQSVLNSMEEKKSPFEALLERGVHYLGLDSLSAQDLEKELRSLFSLFYLKLLLDTNTDKQEVLEDHLLNLLAVVDENDLEIKKSLLVDFFGGIQKEKFENLYQLYQKPEQDPFQSKALIQILKHVETQKLEPFVLPQWMTYEEKNKRRIEEFMFQLRAQYEPKAEKALLSYWLKALKMHPSAEKTQTLF